MAAEPAGTRRVDPPRGGKALHGNHPSKLLNLKGRRTGTRRESPRVRYARFGLTEIQCGRSARRARKREVETGNRGVGRESFELLLQIRRRQREDRFQTVPAAVRSSGERTQPVRFGARRVGGGTRAVVTGAMSGALRVMVRVLCGHGRRDRAIVGAQRNGRMDASSDTMKPIGTSARSAKRHNAVHTSQRRWRVSAVDRPSIEGA